MERARHRRSKSISAIEGTRKVEQHKTKSRISTDSRSHIDKSNWDDTVMLDFGRRSVGRVTGIPMKKLLAEEMSKKVESKRQKPSIIARLMGLEVMPPPCHNRKQQKLSQGTRQKGNIANLQKVRPVHDGLLSKRSSFDQQEFKDVYEDLEASHHVNRRCSSRRHESSIQAKPEVSLIEPEVSDIENFSADENLQDSTMLDATSEMADSSNGLLLKFLTEPDYLLMNHLHDLEVDSGSSLLNQMAVLKPLNSETYGSKAKPWRPREDTWTKHHVVKREDKLLLESLNRRKARASCQFSRFHKDEIKNQVPTKVVLLKPNPGKMKASGSSLNPPHGYPLTCKKDSHGVGFSIPISTNARDIAREITMRMKNGFDGSGNADTMSVGFNGYVGDESSYDATDSDSESDSQLYKLPSSKSFNGGSLCRNLSPRRGESSINKEAKKRLSERWKMSKNYQDLEMHNKGHTLLEKLASPDRKTRASLGGPSYRVGNTSSSAKWDGSSGTISPRDGEKDKLMKKNSRARSLPPLIAGRSPCRSTTRAELPEDQPVIHSRSKAVKGKLSNKEYSTNRDSKSKSRNHHSDQHVFINRTSSYSEASFEIQMEATTKDLAEEHSIIHMAAGEEDMLQSWASDVMMIAESESLNSNLNVDDEKFRTDDLENSPLQELPKELPEQCSPFSQRLGTEPAPSDSSKDADNSSPVSVLDDPFTTEDIPSYESFERVSDELHELRIQLQLLKSESGECSDASTNIFPIEEQTTQSSSVAFDGNPAPGAKGWEIPYTVDVLISAGLQDLEFNMLRTAWHSPDCPLDPDLFDALEKKYKNDTGEMRSERRLLYDRINSALLEIFDEEVDKLCHWGMPKLGMSLKRKGVGVVLEKIMKKVECAAKLEDISIVQQQQWEESRECNGEIEVITIGNEIEDMLIDEIVTQFVDYLH
ncbi:uncharacterized protein LOC127251471 isoform X2 [Andrographis paniculata]|uniref:uncharacterized protein LOC127251471 isoform X2 n=1 Tax=Andrographis paniculata TaxID=175694 RepID=UPI0021E7FFC6|nr:uncharacterized protein LOC127251471 isoform X2 [Andrographis paniculata]